MTSNGTEGSSDGRFVALVAMLAENAMISLGKLANPATGEETVNLDGARAFIDLLEMIEAKTKGNLSSEETTFLKTQLTNLRLNFVSVSGASSDSESSSEKSSTAKAEADIKGAEAESRERRVVERGDDGRPTVVDKRAASSDD